MRNTDKGSKAYLFSIVLVAVIGGLLFGYDTAVISGAEKGLQAFFMGAQDFAYTDTVHGITSSSALIGCIIGSALSGFFATRLGRKKSLFLAGVLFMVAALGTYHPEFLFFEAGKPTFGLLIAFNLYRIIGGIGVGLASAICPMYIAEVAPSNIRGTLVSWNQFAIISGQLIVYIVNFLILGDNVNPVIKAVEGVNQILNPEAAAWTIETGWRLMFLSAVVPSVIFSVLVLLVPETPRYLAMNGQDERALHVLTRINGATAARSILADIKATAEEKTEKLFTYGWMVIFVGIMLSVFQQAVGINAVLYFAPRIFESMGMGDPMVQTVFMGIVNLLFTLLAVLTVEKVGEAEIPAEEIAVNGTLLEMQSPGIYRGDIDLTQNGTIALTGISNLQDWYIDPDYLRLEGASLLFNAVSGRYEVTLDTNTGYATFIRLNNSGAYATFSEGGLYLMGYGVGHPSVGAEVGWTTEIAYAMAQVRPGVYQFTGMAMPEKDQTIGGRFRMDYISIKYFGQRGWGDEKGKINGQTNTVQYTESALQHFNQTGSDNIEFKTAETEKHLEQGATYRLTVDLSRLDENLEIIDFVKVQ